MELGRSVTSDGGAQVGAEEVIPEQVAHRHVGRRCAERLGQRENQDTGRRRAERREHRLPGSGGHDQRKKEDPPTLPGYPYPAGPGSKLFVPAAELPHLGPTAPHVGPRDPDGADHLVAHDRNDGRALGQFDFIDRAADDLRGRAVSVRHRLHRLGRGLRRRHLRRGRWRSASGFPNVLWAGDETTLYPRIKSATNPKVPGAEWPDHSWLCPVSRLSTSAETA